MTHDKTWGGQSAMLISSASKIANDRKIAVGIKDNYLIFVGQIEGTDDYTQIGKTLITDDCVSVREVKRILGIEDVSHEKR